ncbi:MAG: tryptophan 7-halogenase [Kangiellaceae bacterium]|nr:tryptophan 7-halogenase [Kangiellaceae bacterium]
MTEVKNVVIVGGGTSGWLTAAILAKKFSDSKSQIQITLIESSEILTIGVGEGTFPTMLHTLQYIGIDEREFLKTCQASFKQAIKFVNWRKTPNSQSRDYYYHLFNAPAQAQGIDLTNEWLAYRGHKPDFAHAVSAQAYICDQNLGPRNLEAADYSWKAKYAYHLDAGKFGELLRHHTIKRLGVKHKIMTVAKVEQNEYGIASVSDGEEEKISGDFFIDCSGFASLLIGKALRSEWVDKSKQLFVDHALAMQVPNDKEKIHIASSTISTAQEAGWIWDIGLQNRRGIGYVYSSAYTEHERAEETLRRYVGPAETGLSVKRLTMNVGYRKQCWKKNCVAVGFSGGFMEPLEATAIAMVETAALLLAGSFPEKKEAIPAVAQKFNQIFEYRWEKIADFIKLHYCLSERRDSQFWIDNCKRSSISDALKAKLELWKYFPPSENDFANKNEMFGLSSYQYILYGMGFQPDLPLGIRSLTNAQKAEQVFSAIRQQGIGAKDELSDHMHLVSQLSGRH